MPLSGCDRRGDVIACVAAAALLRLLQPRHRFRGRRRRRDSGWSAPDLAPTRLYRRDPRRSSTALWWIGWGHNAETHFTLQNLLASPRYVAEAIAVGVGALSGLGTEPSTLSAEPVWGRTLLIALIAAVGLLIYRRKRVDPIVWPIAAAAIANWFLTAFNEIPGREPTASRYQYVSAIFILMILAGLLRGSRLGKRTLIVGGLATALAIAPNLVVLHKGREFFAEQTIFTRSDTAALEIARRTVSPEFAFTPEVAGTGSLIDINAAKYFEAVEGIRLPGLLSGRTGKRRAAGAPASRHPADPCAIDCRHRSRWRLQPRRRGRAGLQPGRRRERHGRGAAVGRAEPDRGAAGDGSDAEPAPLRGRRIPGGAERHPLEFGDAAAHPPRRIVAAMVRPRRLEPAGARSAVSRGSALEVLGDARRFAAKDPDREGADADEDHRRRV